MKTTINQTDTFYFVSKIQITAATKSYLSTRNRVIYTFFSGQMLKKKTNS